MSNPLLSFWSTPYETPPFDLIEVSHFRPAAEESINSALVEVNAITENVEEPTFDNTIAALEKCGRNLGRVSSVMFNLNSAETDKQLQDVTQEVAPLLVRFSNDVTMNERLFKRVKALYDIKEKIGLTTEQSMLLEKTYRNFILGGAALAPDKRARFREISEQLAKLTLSFEANVLDETNSFELHLTDEKDLAGLPNHVIEMAGLEAEKRKKKGWVFTLNQPSYVPFMQYSERRDLREKMFRAYSSRAFHGDQKDNRSLVLNIVNLRLEKARILGFNNYAEMVLGDRMAENPQTVMDFLNKLHPAAHDASVRDFNNIQAFAETQIPEIRIERWDWLYFSEKLKKAKYNIDDEILKPYFNLEKVRDSVFGLASDLFGLSFLKNINIPVYNKEVETYEVFDRNGEILSILYLDYFPRTGKNSGAWMTSFRDQRIDDGKRIIPLVSIVCNFTRPTAKKPSLLTFNEFTTLLHEFGHALHSMLSRCSFESLSGTNVARDFVELPSQFMENWAFEKEWLNSWAAHYETGERIPEDIMIKIKEASIFNEGYACNRQLGFAFLDMAWHTITEPVEENVGDFEWRAMAKTELFPRIDTSNMSCSFTHLFGGDYAAGYYGYKWAEVLDADAFYYLKENGLFNKEITESFRKNILEKGGSDKPMNLYLKFRGKEPSLKAFLDRSGLNTK